MRGCSISSVLVLLHAAYGPWQRGLGMGLPTFFCSFGPCSQLGLHGDAQWRSSRRHSEPVAVGMPSQQALASSLVQRASLADKSLLVLGLGSGVLLGPGRGPTMGLLRWLRCGLHGHLSPGLSKRKMPRCIEHVLLWSRSSGYRPAAGPRTQALEAVGAWRHQRVASDLGASTGDRRSRAEECPSLGHLPVGTTSSWSVGLPHAG